MVRDKYWLGKYDGVDDELILRPPAGLNDTDDVFFLSGWFSFDLDKLGVTNHLNRFFQLMSVDSEGVYNPIFRVALNYLWKIQIFAFNFSDAAYAVIYGLVTNGHDWPQDTNAHHLFIRLQLGVGMRVAIDGVPADFGTSQSSFPYVNEYVTTPELGSVVTEIDVMGGQYNFYPNPTAMVKGSAADVWFGTATTLALDYTDFWNGGVRPRLPDNGVVNGVTPVVWLRGAHESRKGKNGGTGGDFTMYGAPTADTEHAAF